jgi:hypothetical protein
MPRWTLTSASLTALALACTPTVATTPPACPHAPGACPIAPVPRDSKAGGEKDKKDEPAWSVADPPGEETDVKIDVREGTWISLDVRPDGQEIVFDLLGDLYTLPIGGGEAKALTSGMSWDMQPRYSPDGRWVAFTSDRGGGDNAWVIGAAGGEPRQVTKEDFRLVNSVAWSPDGNYLAVRKHFTKRRSLGAGEIWLYHVSGGKGLQVTEKQNDQKDLGEPAFSPDGNYVYFSPGHDAGAGVRIQQGPVRRDLRDQPGRARDRADRASDGRIGRGGAADAVAGRQDSGVRAAGRRGRRGAGAVDAVHPRPRVGARAGAVRRARPRHAGDVGDPRGLSGVRVDARQHGAGVLGGGEVVADRGRRVAGEADGDPVPRGRDAQGGAGGARADQGRGAGVRRKNAARRDGRAGRQDGGVPGARAPVRQGHCPTDSRGG